MRALKRLIDIVVGAFGLVLVAPLLAVIAILVRWHLGSPVFFRQERPGLHAKPFMLTKFRTMKVAFNAHGEPRPDAERLTRLGRILRSTSVDELPELWNVLRGDMSLVGPRPLLMEYLPLYTPDQARRHEMRPGITGWAQVNGRNAVSWDTKFAHDVWYIDNWTLLLDLKILAMTFSNVVCAHGISQAGRATADKFRGPGH